jgi:hypothetical protein
MPPPTLSHFSKPDQKSDKNDTMSARHKVIFKTDIKSEKKTQRRLICQTDINSEKRKQCRADKNNIFE